MIEGEDEPGLVRADRDDLHRATDVLENLRHAETVFEDAKGDLAAVEVFDADLIEPPLALLVESGEDFPPAAHALLRLTSLQSDFDSLNRRAPVLEPFRVPDQRPNDRSWSVDDDLALALNAEWSGHPHAFCHS